ncbi:MAG TPA: UbiX family flavin prenyltransferase, partial [Dehalococcoidales bacterium]|nr:UbiX family flavin prenyltransferase [Dehalococcoidales bacterium]
IIRHETDWGLEQVRALADVCYDINDIGARLSSGSFKRDGMVIAPCSMKTLSALANSYTDNLIARAADITLKERKRLVLLARETPLHLGYLRNMVKVTEMGAVVFPPVPAFYHKPRKIQDLVDYTVGRVLDIFDIKHNLFPRWEGLADKEK